MACIFHADSTQFEEQYRARRDVDKKLFLFVVYISLRFKSVDSIDIEAD